MNKLTELRMNLIQAPTPLYKLEGISTDFDRNIFVKRDDLTGVGLGGNKARKLEYILHDVLSKRSKYVVTSGSLQTNHGMITALLSSMLGLDVKLLLLKETEDSILDFSGNLLLDSYINADIRIIDVSGIMSDSNISLADKNILVSQRVTKATNRIIEELKSIGVKDNEIYNIESAGSTGLGVLGYVNCMSEIMTQTNLHFDYIFCGMGSGGTYAGLLLGSLIFSPDTKIIGINIDEMGDEKPDFILKIMKQAVDLVGLDLNKNNVDLSFYAGALNEGYAIPDKETFDCIRYVANKEGFFIDPVYTGKVFSGALNIIKDVMFVDKNILILHTGGVPGLFNNNMARYKTDSYTLRWET